MANNGNNPQDDGRLTARLMFVVLLGAVLFLPPLLPAAGGAVLQLGLPDVWVYLFAVWTLLIGLVALLIKVSG